MILAAKDTRALVFRLLSCFVAIALVVIAPVTTAHAQSAAKRILRVELAGPTDELEAMRVILGDGLAASNVTQDTRIVARIDASATILAPPSPPSSALLGYAFLDLSDPARATVYLVDAPRERILVRHIPRTTNAEILHETIGRIVATGVEALLSGSFGELGKPIARPPPPQETGVIRPLEIVQTLPPRPVVTSRVGLFYEGALFSSETALTHGPGIAGALSIGRDATRLGLWITAHYRFPLFTSDPPVGLRLDTTAIRLLVGVEHDIGRAWTLEAAIGPGIDLEHVEPRLLASSDAAYATSARWAVLGLGRALLGVRWSAVAHLSIDASLVLDVDLSGSRFTREAPTDNVVIAPYPLRPGIAFGIFVP